MADRRRRGRDGRWRSSRVAIFGAGLSLHDSVVFAVGLLAGNVPEGLLPVITLALAVAVRALARRGALVKRLSAVETLGSTDVICTDKTGTLTENRMRPKAAWTPTAEVELRDEVAPPMPQGSRDAAVRALAHAAAACNNARLEARRRGRLGRPDRGCGVCSRRALSAPTSTPTLASSGASHQYHFDPQRKLMSTLDAAGGMTGCTPRGRPSPCCRCCASVLSADGEMRSAEPASASAITQAGGEPRRRGMRVLALARRHCPPGAPPPTREEAERELCFLGLIAMRDPPRPEVREAVARCHSAGIRIIVITGDHPLTAAAIARQVGIGGDAPSRGRCQRDRSQQERELHETAGRRAGS